MVVGVVRNRTADGFGIQLDLSDAPVPERRFSADGAWVTVGPDFARVLFAQFKGAGPEVEHVVVMRLSFHAARLFLQSMTDVAKSAHSYLVTLKNSSSPRVDQRSIPNQTFTLDANIIVAGYSGREACMDLYYSSPQVKVALRRGGNELRAEPVARVLLTTRLLIDIHDELKSKMATLPKDEGEEMMVEAQDE